MLVLSRRSGEQIVIGDNVVVTVLSSSRGRVRVGIEAPRSVDVRRSEITHYNVPGQDPDAIDLALLAGTVH